jgi:hypothetical protein
MKTKFRKAIDCIISKDDKKAKAIIKEAIQTDERYISYREQLLEMGIDFFEGDKTVDDKVYDDIHEILKEFPEKIKLKILDIVYLKIATGEKE